jgi:hypothetical protein
MNAICGKSLSEVPDAADLDTHPDFSFCFQYTLLKWAAPLVLWLCAPVWIYMLTRMGKHKIKTSALLLVKNVILLLLM